MRKKQAAPTLEASKEVEAWFEFSASHRETVEKGLRRVDDPDDPRWDDEMKKPPFRAGAEGSLIVAEVTRVDGELVKQKVMTVRYCHANYAREFLIRFRDAKNAGEVKPWDQQRYFRDQIEQAKAAAEEGRAADLEKFQAAIIAALSSKGASELDKAGVA